MSRLHWHEEFLLPSTRRMKSEKARRLAALDARAFPHIANRTFLLGGLSVESKVLSIIQRTSFHRCFGILSASVIGSMNVSFITLVSGIQIAHKRWTQSPSTVCLNAPPSLGHKMHDWKVKCVRGASKNATLTSPPVFLARRCISGTAIDPQEYTAHHNNLGAQQGYTHHKTRSHSCSLPLSRRKWRTSNPQTALPYLAWASFLSTCIVQYEHLELCTMRAHQVKPILLQTVHNDLEGLARYSVRLLPLPLGVHVVEPLHI